MEIKSIETLNLIEFNKSMDENQIKESFRY